jgi:hypothetical protein
MTAKQWAARAVVAATMAAGLSACGGGGDSAAPAVVPAPEELKAGLTIKESTDSDFQPAVYADMKIINTDTVFDTTEEFGRFAQNNQPGSVNHIQLLVRFSKTTGQVSKLTLTKDTFGTPLRAMGCGFDGFSCDNSRIAVNLGANEIRVTSLGLKSLTFSATDSALIISNTDTHLTANPGTATISGAITLK